MILFIKKNVNQRISNNFQLNYSLIDGLFITAVDNNSVSYFNSDARKRNSQIKKGT